MAITNITLLCSFLLPVLIAVLWRLTFKFADSKKRLEDLILLNVIQRCHIRHIYAGELVDFLSGLTKKYRLPDFKIYIFEEKIEKTDPVSDSFITNYISPLPPYIFSVFHPIFPTIRPHYHYLAKPSCSIFVPLFWTELDKACLQWFICHEIGHYHKRRKERWLNLFYYIFLRPQYEQGRHLFKKEVWADAFAAQELGAQRSIDELLKARWLGSQTPNANEVYEAISARVTKIKESFQETATET